MTDTRHPLASVALIAVALLAVIAMHVATVPRGHISVDPHPAVASHSKAATSVPSGGTCSSCVLAPAAAGPSSPIEIGRAPTLVWHGSPRVDDAPDPPVPRRA